MSDYDSMRDEAETERRLASGSAKRVDVKMTVRATVVMGRDVDVSEICPDELLALSDDIEIEEVY